MNIDQEKQEIRILIKGIKNLNLVFKSQMLPNALRRLCYFSVNGFFCVLKLMRTGVGLRLKSFLRVLIKYLL